MARLVWGSFGERYYETGVDRGVLYVGENLGVAWPGLISVSESPSGGDPKPYYLDGNKYLNLSSAEEFEAVISALSNPPEFGPCDGTVSIQNGLFVAQQPRVPFSFSYRTLIGNDVAGNDLGYKIHLVYNALAAPSQRENTTLRDSVDLMALSWSVTTLPPEITGYRPTSHMLVDSRYASPENLSAVEDILYGSESGSAQMPTPDELIAIFTP